MLEYQYTVYMKAQDVYDSLMHLVYHTDRLISHILLAAQGKVFHSLIPSSHLTEIIDDAVREYLFQFVCDSYCIVLSYSEG